MWVSGVASPKSRPTGGQPAAQDRGMTATRRPMCPPETHADPPLGRPGELPSPRTLPFRVAPSPGEALDSWLEALAHRYKVPFGDVLHQCGISASRPGAWMRQLDRDTVARIAYVAGISLDDVDAMALPRADGSPPAAANSSLARILPSGPWDWRANSRYCPRCLDDTGGRWKLAWRINWTFACLAHHCLLVDVCPECGCGQRRSVHPLTRVPHPGQCRGVRRRDTAGALRFCGARLGSTQSIDLSGSPILLEAQRQVTDILLAAARVTKHDRGGSSLELDALRVLVRWCANTIDYSQRQPNDVLACCDPEHLNLAAPKSGHIAQTTAAETAANITTALTILNAHSTTEAAHTWRTLMIAANHGRIHRLSEVDQNTLLPSIRLAYHRAYAHANAHHKLRRYFSTSAAKHQSHLLSSARSVRQRKSEQCCAR
ncbi:TniQ family protein [Mycolicibacterium setense]|uniref:TniQ family protein n=1 Tax=Mycolicibacterium setense TaxID=431269 RepID=UPI0009EE464B